MRIMFNKIKTKTKDFFVKKTLTKRWIYTNLLMIAVSLFIIEFLLIVSVHAYYYNSAQQYMLTKLNGVKGVLTRYYTDNSLNFSAEMRKTAESFSDKDKMELMILDDSGKIVLTSSGFASGYSVRETDYSDALSEASNIGYYRGKSSNGEHIMAISYSIDNLSPEYSVIRVVSSLTNIDKQISNFVILSVMVGLLIFGVVTLMGIIFVNSIAVPIREINAAAASFSKGDFERKVPDHGTDEIGQLSKAINDMAHELSLSEKAKYDFISSVSHELRTPLTAIKSWAETLALDYNAEENAEPNMTRGLEVIIKESNRLTEMIAEIMDFSRLQSGIFTLKSEEVDIFSELEEIILMYGERAKKANVELFTEIPETFPVVLGDINRLRQVFINLLENAINYSKPENAEVLITAHETPGSVVISVSDNGIGIKSEDLPKIRVKFYRAAAAVSSGRRGNGIGLSVCDEIIRLHNGQLDIESEENEGTTVSVTLPLYTA